MLEVNQSALSFRTTMTKVSTPKFTKMCIGWNDNGLGQSIQFTWRLSVKVGDLVQWHSEYKSCTPDKIMIDYGLVVELDESGQLPGDAKGVYIQWFSNDGNGWFDIGHPAIGVISESRRSG